MAPSFETLPVAEAARRLGRYAWLEARLFEILGGWVPAVPEPEAKLLIASHSYHHAWHAELWRQRLPVLAGVNHAELTVAGSGQLTAFMHTLAEPPTTVEKLVGVYRVLVPRLVATYTSHLERASTVAEAPTVRALRLVLADEANDWLEGERVVQSLLPTPDEVSRASAHQGRLEALLVEGGGVAGPAPTGAPANVDPSARRGG